jgi:uncharacterized membrane protein HdeD (DUF308 family)
MSSTEPTGAPAYRSGSATGVPVPQPESDVPAGSAPHRQGEVPIVRTWWDVVIGGILVGTGVVVLGDVAVASVVSVLFLGWTLVIGGAVSIVASMFLVGRGSFWVGMLGGVTALVAGIVFLRYPDAALLALSLAVGAAMLVNGITRLAAAVKHREARLALVLSGALSLVLGSLILSQWPTSAVWLLGTLLGIQLVVDGATLILIGRPRLLSA